ncbi:hypothetical protein EAY16_25825, partial [Vibrio anguillarum]|nr:hypothetical protein [Vibrio anguillarum]
HLLRIRIFTRERARTTTRTEEEERERTRTPVLYYGGTFHLTIRLSGDFALKMFFCYKLPVVILVQYCVFLWAILVRFLL